MVPTHSIFAKEALLPTGWGQNVLLEVSSDGCITSVQEGASPDGHSVDKLLPAPVNLHSHAFQRAMAGLTERRGHDPKDSFWTWRDLMYRFLDQLTPSDVQAIAEMVQLEMLEAGYAGVAEFHYLHHRTDGAAYDNIAEMAERIGAAAQVTGIGMTLLPVLYQVGGCDNRALAGGQTRFGNSFERYEALFDRSSKVIDGLAADANLGVAPHSLRAVRKEDLSRVVGLTKGPVHMHLAEQTAEVEEVVSAWGARPVEWLLANVDVQDRWCLIHCTQMTEEETLGLAKTGAIAGLCPITEANLGDGIFNGVSYLTAGGRFGVGSDSNVRISLTEELRSLEYSQRLKHKGRAMLATGEKSSGRVLFEEACRGGAQAAGRGTGRLEVGQWADMLSLDTSGPDTVGRHGDVVLDSWIFATRDHLVRDVWSAGRHVVENGQHPKRTQIRNRFAQVMMRLQDVL